MIIQSFTYIYRYTYIPVYIRYIDLKFFFDFRDSYLTATRLRNKKKNEKTLMCGNFETEKKKKKKNLVTLTTHQNRILVKFKTFWKWCRLFHRGYPAENKPIRRAHFFFFFCFFFFLFPCGGGIVFFFFLAFHF